ncbi:uncharacterized protein CBL_12556 [Carabus blaptoides fortunei]
MDSAQAFGNEMNYEQGLNFTVDPAEDSVLIVNKSEARVVDSDTRKVISLAKALDIFNTEALAQSLPLLQSSLSHGCKARLAEYIEGLRNNEKWAMKMDDASGRYTTGWYWGNHYWTGSRTLCENIAPNNKKISATSRQSSQLPEQSIAANVSRKRRNARASLSTTPSPSSFVGYSPGPLEQDHNIPFPVAFYMLKMDVNITAFTSQENNVNIGLCLPRTCSDRDVRRLMEKTAETGGRARLQVLSVRSHNQYYNMWDDATFRILCGTTIAVTIMLLTGTSYDLYLQKEKEKKKMTLNCTTYDLTNPKHVKLDINIPSTKITNGKNSMYVVNNNVAMTEEGIGETSAEPEDDGNPDITKILSEVLLSFSIRTNFKQICEKSVGSDTISAIHGLRSISMAWVILGHTCIVAFKYSDNMDFRKLVEKEFFFQTVTNGAFSVDTFFFISGLLVSFLYFRTNAKGKLEALTQGSKGFTAGFLHFIGLLGYRFARLTAPYLYVLGVVEVCMKWFNYNSIFEPPTMDHVNCPNYWWRNVLYINTLFPVEQMCMLWSWYLSDDTQFYIVGAIILILANSYFKTASVLLVLLLVSSWSTTGYIAFVNSHMPSSDDPLALFDKIYDKPWTRLGPYLVGMAIGWLLFKTNCRIQMSKLTVLVGWLGSIAVLMSLVYGLYEADLSPIAGAAYSSLSHTAWAVGLAWIVVACATGYGGYVNSILSASILYPFSRVTYCAYLIHPLVLRGMTMSMDSPLHLGMEVMTIMFLGQVVASYVLSFIVSLAFEAPVVTMLKILTQFKVKKSH